MLIQFSLNLFRSPDEDNTNPKVTRSLNGSLDFACRSVIATHCVHSDLKHKPLGLPTVDCRFPNWIRGFSIAKANRKSAIGLLFFFHFNGDAPTIEATFGAHSMRRARFSAVGTVSHRDRSQVIVRTALAGARL